MVKLLTALFILAASPAFSADPIRFGDNTSQWADDGECDDRRFYGAGVDVDLVAKDIGHDANDCRKLLAAGHIKIWVEEEARAATRCNRIKFGDNTSQWADDNSCDDPRFEGRGSAKDVVRSDIGHDAADCRLLCKSGLLSLRNY